jgi:hypothetical protein
MKKFSMREVLEQQQNLPNSIDNFESVETIKKDLMQLKNEVVKPRKRATEIELKRQSVLVNRLN